MTYETGPLSLSVDPDDGGLPIALVDHPEIGVTRFDPGTPAVRVDSRPRAGRSGHIDRSTFHGDRIVTLELESDTASGDFARLLACMDPARRPTVTFRRHGQASRRMTLVGRSFTAPHSWSSPNIVDALLVWAAPDGIVEAADAETAEASAGQAEGGYTYPVTYPKVRPDVGARGVTDVHNRGDIAAWPVIRFDGPLTGPTLTNDTTGQTIGLAADYVIPVGDYVELDHRAGTATLNGDPTALVYRHLDLPASTFWTLPPGASSLRFRAEASTQPAGVTITWRPAWPW